METTDKPAFVAILNGMAAVKPGANLTKEAYEIWWNSMQDWTLEDFRTAASHLVTAIQFMPNPYDFSQLRKAGEPTASEAWTSVLGGSSLEPGSVTERAAAAVGGQQAIRHANIEKDLPHIQRRFLEAYEEISDAQATRKAVPRITGKAQDVLTHETAAIRRVADQRARTADAQVGVMGADG